MPKSVAVIGAGVSGLSGGIVLAEHGYNTAIFAEAIGQGTTSAAAAALWFPYDAEPFDSVITWGLETYKVLADLCGQPQTGVSMIELRTFSRAGEARIPTWATPLGARDLESGKILAGFTSGFTMTVPLMDTTRYLDYLRERFTSAGGLINSHVHFEKLEDVNREFNVLINCAGIGARTLVPDPELEPHRGQVAIVPKIDIPYAIVCDDPPLMYIIPRTHDCVFGGTNEISDDWNADPNATSRIVAECSRVLKIESPKILAERVGLRPFRKSGINLSIDRLRDGRSAVHNYGHGGAGFTLSWGCAQKVFDLVRTL